MPDWSGEIRARLDELRIDAAREAEVVEELSQHLDERYEELKRAGACEADAHRVALDELTAPDVLTERMRSLKQATAPAPLPPPTMKRSLAANVWLDVRYAARALRNQRRFTIAIILTLALGIGANTAIFSLVNATLLTPLPVSERQQLAYVSIGGSVVSYPRYEALRDGSETFAGLAAWGGIAVSFDAGDSAELVEGYIVTGNFFDVLGLGAARGRLLSPGDDSTPGAHPVAVISHELWRTRFGGRDDVVGRDIRLNGNVFTIVGIAPAGFPGPRAGTTGHVYAPMMMQPFVRPPSAGYAGEQNPDLLRNPRGWLSMVGRLRDGASPEQARAELTSLLAGPARDTQPAAPPGAAVDVVRIDDEITPDRQRMTSMAWLLGATVAVVLLIACANIANLLLTKAAARQLEFAVRLALGASRARIVRQLLAESVMLSLLGGALGVALAWALAAAFRMAPPPSRALPLELAFAIDARVLLFTLALSAVTGVLFGLAPALRASRPSLVPALKDSRFESDARGRRIDVKKPLVVAQIALSLLLLIAAGLFVRALDAARAIELGFDADRLVAAPLNINLLRYTTTQGREFYRDVVERVESLPGVESATLARVAVLSGSSRTVPWSIQGREEPSRDGARQGGPPFALGRNLINANVVGPNFFDTLGIVRLAGRDFDSRDSAEAPYVAIINDAAAKLHFAGADPLGARVSFSGPAGPWYEIVGVVGNSKYANLGEHELPVVYAPLAQNHETGMTLYVRASVPPASLVDAVRREIQALQPALPVLDARVMADTIGTALYSASMSARLLAGFGALALLLAAIGIYGVLSFSIASRTREIGIRLALGSRARDVFNVVLRDGLTLVAAGVVVGVLGALVAGRMLAGFLYGVSPADAATYVTVTAMLCAVAVAACAIPARRAMRMDPMAALRYQ
jgi:predicted permease